MKKLISTAVILSLFSTWAQAKVWLDSVTQKPLAVTDQPAPPEAPLLRHAKVSVMIYKQWEEKNANGDIDHKYEDVCQKENEDIAVYEPVMGAAIHPYEISCDSLVEGKKITTKTQVFILEQVVNNGSVGNIIFPANTRVKIAGAFLSLTSPEIQFSENNTALFATEDLKLKSMIFIAESTQTNGSAGHKVTYEAAVRIQDL